VYKLIILLFSVSVIFSASYAFAQEPQLATFQESAQIIVDQTISKNVTASITLQSTSIQEIRIPADLENKIRNTDKVVAIILTNEESCVLGVLDESCIMINISREGIEGGIIAIQDLGKEIGDMLIEEINNVFDTDAQFHSVFIHYEDESNRILETSGVVSGRGIVSAVYTMPKEDTDSMYEKISTILLPKVIRDAGGFYDIAKIISRDEDSRMTFSFIPLDNSSLL